jgi:hypothetical protein
MVTYFHRAQLLTRAKSLRRFNDWEARHPIELGAKEAVAVVGAVYSLMPIESRKRSVDPSGAGTMRKALSHLAGDS